MKKPRQSPFSERLQYAPLYLDDIERIVDAVKAQLPQVVFRDQDYEYESLEELKERHGARVKQIEIVGRNPERFGGITINIEGRRVALFGDSDYELLWHQIRAMVNARLPWYAKIIAPNFWGPLLLILASQYVWFIDKQTKAFTPPAWFHVLVTASAILFAFSVWQVTVNRGVVLERRHAVRGFVSRNFDRLLMLAIGGLLTLLGKFIYGWLFGANG